MHNKNRLAVIDVGTLHAKLEIREASSPGHSRVLHRDKKLVVLGRDLHKTSNMITEPSIKGAIAALRCFKAKMDECGTTRYEAVTTEAVRRALNAEEVLTRIATETGITLRVLTHEDEARLFFQHVAKSFPNKRIAVADIGGGSVQLTIGTDATIDHTYLFKTGAYFMQETLSKTHYPTVQEVANARQYIQKAFAKLTALNLHVDELVYGSTNTIDFLEVTKVRFVPSGYEAPHLFRAWQTDLEKLFARIIDMPYENRMPMFPSEPYYMWSADNALLNVFGFMEALHKDSVIPTNENLSASLFDTLAAQIASPATSMQQV